MPKLTKELRDRCVAELRDFASSFSTEEDRDIVLRLADALAACEVEEEPVSRGPVDWDIALAALTNQGWYLMSSAGRSDRPGRRWYFTRGDRVLELWSVDGQITKTRYCPPDLLDGRLAALDEEATDGK